MVKTWCKYCGSFMVAKTQLIDTKRFDANHHILIVVLNVCTFQTFHLKTKTSLHYHWTHMLHAQNDPASSFGWPSLITLCKNSCKSGSSDLCNTTSKCRWASPRCISFSSTSAALQCCSAAAQRCDRSSGQRWTRRSNQDRRRSWQRRRKRHDIP